MSDPNELSDDARMLLRIARSSGTPDPAALARVRASVLRDAGVGAAAIGAAAGTSKLASSTPPTIGSAATATSGLTLLAKSAAVLAVIGATAAALYAFAPAAPPAPSTVSSAAASPTAVTTASEPTQEALPPTVLTKAPPAPRVESSAAGPARARRQKVANAPVERPTTATPTPSLADDLARLREAQLALTTGQPERAVEALQGVEDGSSLSVERDGLRTLARCAIAKRGASGAGEERGEGEEREAGEHRARVEAERFLAAHPHASIGARVRSACDVH